MDEAANFRKVVLDNLESFVAEHFVNLETGKKIVLASYQSDFIRRVLKREKSKYIMIASTRVGKTESNCIMAVLVAILFDGEEVIIVAHTFRHAEKMFRRIKGYFESDKRLLSFVDKTKAFRRDEVNLVNGSVLRCLSAGNPEALLGFGATTLIVDEAASIPDDVYKTRIVRMIASSKSKERRPIMVLISTPHVINHFYDSWMSEDFEKVKVTWREGVKAGILDKEVVEYNRKIMTEAEFAMWFEAEFQPGEKAMYDRRLIKELMLSSRENNPVAGYDYYGGLDIARMGTDETAFVVVKVPSNMPLDEAPISMVFESCRAKKLTTDTIGWIKELVSRWNIRLLGVDMLGMGAPVLDMLTESLGNKIVGIKMMGDERVEVYTNLQSVLENKRLTLLDMEKLEYQFGSFSLSYQSDGRKKVSKNVNMKDDLVDALAFAVWMLRSEKSGEFSVYEPILKVL